MSSRSLLPGNEPVVVVDAGNEADHQEIPVAATQDLAIVRRWAEERGAEPATGEASESGPATVVVRDGDAGIRFNFPAAGRYRPISWEEWFDHFSRHELIFIFERTAPGSTPSGRYRLVKADSLKKRGADVIK